jgi:hypothetical protein
MWGRHFFVPADLTLRAKCPAAKAAVTNKKARSLWGREWAKKLFSSILIRYTGAVITTAVSQLKDGLTR